MRHDACKYLIIYPFILYALRCVLPTKWVWKPESSKSNLDYFKTKDFNFRIFPSVSVCVKNSFSPTKI